MAKNKEWREPDSEGIFIIDVTAAALAKEKNIETTGKTTLIAVMPASPTLLPTKYPSTIEYMPERANARIDGITKRKNFFEYIKIPISKIFFIWKGTGRI